jgi:hypothetical protein
LGYPKRRCRSRRRPFITHRLDGLHDERRFAELTNKWLRRGTHRSSKELEASIAYWIDTWNDEPKPFVWHKTADETLDTLSYILRAGLRLTDLEAARRTMAIMQ